MKCYDLIKYIVWFATNHGVRLSNNRLVKFVYLADLFQARIKHGETITGFPWRFIHYGPYCSEVAASIDDATKNNMICVDTYQSRFAEDKEYGLFWCSDDDAENIEEMIHIGVLGQLQQAIKKFGDDTPLLLDYVYFETEPMQNVKKYDYLDFSKVRQIDTKKRIEFKKLSSDTVKAVREKIKGITGQVEKDRAEMLEEERRVSKYKDKLYYQLMEKIDGDPLETGLAGTAKIQINE